MARWLLWMIQSSWNYAGVNLRKIIISSALVRHHKNKTEHIFLSNQHVLNFISQWAVLRASCYQFSQRTRTIATAQQLQMRPRPRDGITDYDLDFSLPVDQTFAKTYPTTLVNCLFIYYLYLCFTIESFTIERDWKRQTSRGHSVFRFRWALTRF